MAEPSGSSMPSSYDDENTLFGMLVKLFMLKDFPIAILTLIQ
jgi:hypothetical protein